MKCCEAKSAVGSTIGKVCILTTVHPPFDTRIFHKQAKTLVDAGYDVTLIAQHDKDEVVDGVKIVALPKPKNRLQRMFRLTLKAFRLALKQNAHVYHFHDPELIPVGLLLKASGKKVIYDVHEDVPQQILSKEWIPGFLRKIISCFTVLIENFASRAFDAIIPATPAIGERFERLNWNTVIVQNFPLLDELYQEKMSHKKEKAVVYIGVISVQRGINEMVTAMGLLKKHRDAKLLLGGKFIQPSLEEQVKKLPGLERVEFLGWLDRFQVAEVLSKSTVGLVLIHPEPRYKVSYPVKLFEYMSAGLPVIASNFPLWKEIVEGNNCGITVDPLNPYEIAEAIEYLLDNPDVCAEMGRNGRKAVEEKYNWEAESMKLVELYRSICAN